MLAVQLFGEILTLFGRAGTIAGQDAIDYLENEPNAELIKTYEDLLAALTEFEVKFNR